VLGVHLTLLAVQLAFASGALVGRMAFVDDHVDPTALAFIRAAAAAIAFALFRQRSVAREAASRAAAARVSKRLPTKPMLILGLLGVVINQAFFLHGLKRGTATSATILCATIPVFTAAIGILARVEQPRIQTWLGLALASIGVITLTGVRDISLGNLLVTLNSLSYACYLVMVGRYIREFGALRVIGAVFAWGAVVLACPGIPALVLHAHEWTARGWWLVAWFVFVPTIFAYLANAWALGKAPPSVVAAYVYLQPMIVMLLAHRMLGEGLDARTLIAAAAILGGVTIIVLRKNADRHLTVAATDEG
jgi:drug/metabolite transporter (DMT)-like permease